MESKYNLDKIKFGIDSGTWEKAVVLYETGKVKNFQDTGFTYVADVLGTESYQVVVSKNKFTDGNCTCYLGQNDTLCKHMIAVAIYGLKSGQSLTEEEKTQHNIVKFSGKTGEITQDQLNLIKMEISGAMRFIKAYTGPSRIWFDYQDSLTEGCNRLSAVFSRLSANLDTANLVVNTLLKLDKKLQTGGVDDSDGTVGGFIEESVNLLLDFYKADPKCAKSFKKLEDIETCFGWEEPLMGKLER
ncbi:hypothetical protein COV89_03310 [Candidatus Shapirobacteria bacterium CG11_big_fil_rev_8_21_14_0_20_40_12]|uniref:SWIM-type domain-containing protein n=2 Tax=Candidatus Shapironibacteriota TaxID=1752721 RepID=A0A2M8GF56_9BACT|nr:MAG: hypothetical protein COV89_03310 [Candidatus Shapirobacteria bacterium CG11_big_fil_rev_8_21_14_0_20_40_12]PJC75846.1 MAG: hypothetical protein CO010_04245 [Candidatus Shapirobacteria bacterium CG_4_8_14_3_um_filter_39_11]